MRFESKGGRLPGSSGPIVATPPSESASGKKRALPTWGGGGGGGGAASGRAKKETPSWRATPPPTAPTAPSLFTPSYTPPPPRSSGKDKTGAGAGAGVDARTTSKSSGPWTSDAVLKVIKGAGSSGATLEVRIYLRDSLPFFKVIPVLVHIFHSVSEVNEVFVPSSQEPLGAWRYLLLLIVCLLLRFFFFFFAFFYEEYVGCELSPKAG